MHPETLKQPSVACKPQDLVSLPQMEPKEAAGKETMGSKRKNLTFLRSRLYMLERRKTDTVVDSSVSGDHSGSLRRSQSDRTEYNQKLQGKPKRKQLPQVASLSTSGFGLPNI